MQLFHLSKENSFNLSYLSLDLRRTNFCSYATRKILEIKVLNLVSILNDFIIEDLELDILVSSNGGNWRRFFENILEDYLTFLFVLDKFTCKLNDKIFLLEIQMEDMQANGEHLDHITEYPNDNFNNLEAKYSNLINIYQLFRKTNIALNDFDLDYFYNEETQRIERKLDEANSNNIIQNLEKLNNPSYEQCIDEFLGVEKTKNKKEFYRDSLGRIKRVLEEMLKSKFSIEKPFTQKKSVMNKIIPGKGGIIENSLEFIIKNIHHPGEGSGENFKPYDFSRQEYIYWWLELNNLIHLLSQN